MLHAARVILLAAVITLPLGACDPKTTQSPDEAAAVGVYTLQTIDGAPLPVVVARQGTDSAQITQGSVTLDASKSFADVTTLRVTDAGVVTIQDDPATGRWSLAGRNVQFTPDDGSAAYVMVWDGADQLTQVTSGFTLVYRR